jgi:hypothetical protein
MALDINGYKSRSQTGSLLHRVAEAAIGSRRTSIFLVLGWLPGEDWPARMVGPFDGTHGALAQATPMQPSNGRIYGVTERGNANGLNQGVLYGLDNAAPPSVLLTTVSGTAGQTVQILAGGLTGTSKVKFGSATARFHVVSDTFLTATVPNNGTTGLVSVTTRSRTLVSNRKFFVLPVISSFTPTSGPVGTQVMIVGRLLGATQVKFGCVKATSFTVNSATSITASVLSGAVTGKVAVTTAGGTAMSQAAFT